MQKIVMIMFVFGLAINAQSQNIMNNPSSNHGNRFEQLGTILPTANEYRTASGAPGPKYWQQRADYTIKCELDEANLKLKGSETVTYYNNSPDILTYIWLQLDENEHSSINNAGYQIESIISRQLTTGTLDALADANKDNGLGHKIAKLTDATGKSLAYTINKTMMRIELPTALKPGQKFIFNLDWSYIITNRMTIGGRGGFETLEDGNNLFTIAQWFPRLCVYSDFQGWQNHQFTGRGEFALVFGNYNVQITLPADHIVLGTGVCQNYAQVLSPAQMARWNQAQNAKEPVEIATLDEALKAEKTISTQKKTWIFKAENVRDFAWTSSRRYIWDAMPINIEGKKVMCMSGYPKEAYGLYRKFSTKAVAHTIKSYSKFSIPYPYPVAQSIEATNGMEYPMICFNNGRTNKDGSYSEATKIGMLGVIIHEVGHNFFPMIVNSDERQWSWMDEGLNTFVQYLTEELWDNKYPSRRGPAWGITSYMKLPKDQLEPIMTNSENIVQFGNNAYSKPATALNILRETIMGRKLFDYSFREYARRWAFKHPTPADLFRTMEDASAEDLDWYWRGWFYGIEPCDIAIDTVKYVTVTQGSSSTPSSTIGQGRVPQMRGLDKPLFSGVNAFDDISKIRNRSDKNILFQTDVDTSLRDFYWRYTRGLEQYDSTIKFEVVPFAGFSGPVEPTSGAEKAKYANVNLYEITFSNKGGLIMPIIVEFSFADGTSQVERIPAQIWRLNENKVTKVFMTKQKAVSIKLDPLKETADIDETNNVWPAGSVEPSKFSLFKAGARAGRGQSSGPNPMQNSIQKNK